MVWELLSPWSPLIPLNQGTSMHVEEERDQSDKRSDST